MIFESNPSTGADSYISSPLPWGRPSTTSTRTTSFANSFSAMRCAEVAPTLPAPITVIFTVVSKSKLRTNVTQGMNIATKAPRLWICKLRNFIFLSAFVPSWQICLRFAQDEIEHYAAKKKCVREMFLRMRYFFEDEESVSVYAVTIEIACRVFPTR